MAPTYIMPRAALGRDLGHSLMARALDAATTSTSTASPTANSNLSHTTSPTAESDMMTIAVEKIKPWLVPMALIIIGFIVLVFLCCCVRWKRLAEIREDHAAGKQPKQKSERSLNNGIEDDKYCLSEKTSSVLGSSQASKDGVKTETRARSDVESATKSKPVLVIDTSPTRKEERTDDVSENFEEYIAREVGRITTPSTTTTSAFTEIVETEGDRYLGGDLRAPTPASLYSTRSSSPTSSVRSVSSGQRKSARSSATLSISVTPTMPAAVEEGSETTLAHIDNTVDEEIGQPAKVIPEEEAVVTTPTSEDPVGIALTTEENVAIVAAAQDSQTSTTTTPPPADTPVTSPRLIVYPRVDAARSTKSLNLSEVNKVYNSRTLVLSAPPNVL